MARQKIIKDAVRRELYLPKQLDDAYGEIARRRGVSKALVFRVGLEAGLAVVRKTFPAKLNKRG